MLKIWLIAVFFGIVWSDEEVVDYTPGGPAHWPGVCTTGKRQSPIDISAANVIFSQFEELVFTNYDKTGSVDLIQLGDTIQAHGFPEWNDKRPSISGGGLMNTYKLVQIHFHWSDNGTHGSEHSIGGIKFPVEIHFVHVKDNRTIAQALNETDGMMVLAVFATISIDSHHFAPLIDAIQLLNNGKMEQEVGFTINPGNLLPVERLSFYRYEGSLTTPNCTEAVLWTVLPAPISITNAQLNSLRKIRQSVHLPYNSNTRPSQPLNGRKIHFQLRFAHRRASRVARSQLTQLKPPTNTFDATS